MATKQKSEQEIISEAMGLLGKRTSEKKRAAVARNNVATRFKAKPLEALVCTCDQCPDNPKTYCPRGRAIIRRRAKAILQAQGSDTVTTNTIEYSNVATDNEEGFAAMAARKRDKLRALMLAPDAEREAALKASAPLAAAYYETDTGREELADWRAIQGEPFHD